MVFSDFTYAGITFNRFVRTSGYMASVVAGDRIQIRTTKDPLPSQDGIQRYLDYYGSRLLELRGSVKGSSESDLYTKINGLFSAFDILSLEDQGNYGFLPLEWTDPGQSTARYYVKPLNNTIIIQEARTGLSRQFSVLLEAKDPIKYSDDQTTYTITPASSGSSSEFPFTFPVAFSASSASGSTTIVNSGTSPVFPNSVILYGPSSGGWTGAKITNSTSGEYIGLLSSFSIGVGERVELLPATGQALYYLSNGTYSDVSASLIAGSTYWKIQPGSNNILLEGSSFPSTAYATLTVRNSF
jgi:hypothetical protein